MISIEFKNTYSSITNRRLFQGIWILSRSIFVHFRAPVIAGMFLLKCILFLFFWNYMMNYTKCFLYKNYNLLKNNYFTCSRWESNRCLHLSSSSPKSSTTLEKFGIKVSFMMSLSKRGLSTVTSFKHMQIERWVTQVKLYSAFPNHLPKSSSSELLTLKTDSNPEQSWKARHKILDRRRSKSATFSWKLEKSFSKSYIRCIRNYLLNNAFWYWNTFC